MMRKINFLKYLIEKDLTNEEKNKITKIIDNTKCLFFPLDIKDLANNDIFTKTYSLVEDYKNPYDSLFDLRYYQNHFFKKSLRWFYFLFLSTRLDR